MRLGRDESKESDWPERVGSRSDDVFRVISYPVGVIQEQCDGPSFDDDSGARP